MSDLAAQKAAAMMLFSVLEDNGEPGRKKWQPTARRLPSQWLS